MVPFQCICYVGFWIGDILTTVERKCINDKQSVQIRQVLSLAPVICIGITLVLQTCFLPERD